MSPNGYLMLVLNGHPPTARRRDSDLAEERGWGCQFVSESFLPLVSLWDQLADEGVAFRMSLSLTPSLGRLWADEEFNARCGQHLARLQRLAEYECERTRPWPALHSLAQGYRRHFQDLHATLVERWGGRLLEALQWHQAAGHVELLASAADTDLPRLSRSGSRAFGERVAALAQEHQRAFGERPDSLWLPECDLLFGVDEALTSAGLRSVVVDALGLEQAEFQPTFGADAPLACPAGIVAFTRQATAANLLEHRAWGYVADGNYRDCYRDLGFELGAGDLAPFWNGPGIRAATGIRYYRQAAETRADTWYDPQLASRTVQRHARHFAGRCRQLAARSRQRLPFPSVIVASYNMELFGRRWQEGPEWLSHLLRELAQGHDVALATPARYLDEYPISPPDLPPAGSWDQGACSRFAPPCLCR